MLTPDMVLDWLKDQREAHGANMPLDEVIDAFNREFDTEDSPLPDRVVTRPKKPSRKATL